MNRKEILAELQQWQTVQKALDAEQGKAANLPTHYDPFWNAVYDMAHAHTEAVARLVGDTAGFLEWWQFECKYGENPLSAGKGDKLRLISNLKQLAGLIHE